MDIAALSVVLLQNKAVQQASVSVAKKAMDFAEVQMQGIVEMMNGAVSAPAPRLDLRV